MTARSSYTGQARVHPSTLSGARRVGYLLSLLLMFASLTLAIPLAVSAGYGESETVGDFAATLLIGVVIGAAGYFFLRTDLAGLTRREGFAAVALGWLMVCALGAVPFVLAGGLDPINAWFETVSGFSGTGSSVIPDVESLPKGLLFWRSFTHWLGGMGFVALYIAIFPLMGVGAMQLFRAEAPGLEMDRLRPRISSTARILWLIYLGMSVILTVLLMAGGMGWFDAVCQMFAAIGTGGLLDQEHQHRLVPQRLHRLGDHPLPVDRLHQLRALVGGARRQAEAPAQGPGVALLLARAARLERRGRRARLLPERRRRCTTRSATRPSRSSRPPRPPASPRPTTRSGRPSRSSSSSCCCSWAAPPAPRPGAMKAVRVYLFAKQALRGLFTTVHPQSVAPVRLGGRAVAPEVMHGISTFMGLYLLTYVVAVAAVSLTDVDFATAMSAVATAMGGVGPGLGEIGPFDNFLWMHPFAKVVLTFCMLAGRLELFTLMLIFVPAYWRR